MVPEKLQTIVDTFQSAPKQLRLQLLLEYSKKVPPLPAELAENRGELERVHECQTPVYLWVEVDDGRVHIYADVPPESPTVRGFISLLARSLEGAAPEDVARIPDDLLDRLGR